MGSRKKINRASCKTDTGINFDTLMALTGYFGVNQNFDEKKCKHFDCKFDRTSGIIFLELEDDYFEVFKRHIYLKIGHVDNIEVRKTENAGSYVSTRLLLSQVEHAEQESFDLIVTHAYGVPNDPNDYNGSTTWGELGYTMCDDGDLEKFANFMRQHSLNYSCLFDLLHSPDRGIWINELCYDWLAEFELGKGQRTVNKDYLNKHLIFKAEKYAASNLDTTYFSNY